MSDKRPISDYRFGLEWEPKLAEIMLRFPWQDSDFAMADPATVCKTCGRAPASVNHIVEQSISLIRNSEMVPGAHDFEPRGPFSEAEIAAAREEWRRRMANLPTKEALEAWHGAHYMSQSRLMALLMTCKVKTRDDVELLGCTGCAAMGLTVEDTNFLRIGLAGSGVGLPCFVPPDRFCYVHGVSGGLQEGQEQRHAERVVGISRPLNAAEAGHSKLVTAARRARTEHDTHSLLHGHELPKGWEEEASDETLEEAVEGLREEGGIDDAEAFAPWKCTEHDETAWTCRHCVAQAVVEGELTPEFVIAVVPGGILRVENVEAELESNAGAARVEVFARVATFTRRLARD